jgi:hypothetical protein
MRRVLFALALIALAGGLTACGVRSTVDPVAAAATRTQDAGGFQAKMSITVSADGRKLTMTGQGFFGRDRGEMQMDMGGLLGAAGAPSTGDSTMKAIYLTEDGNPVIYLNLGFLAAFLPGGKAWVRVDLEQAGKASGIDINQLMSGAGQNPSDSLALLRSSGDFSEVGKETVEGVETTHYHGAVDLRKAAAANGARADAIQRILDLGAPSQYPIDVWIDDAGYVRQYEASYDQTAGGKSFSTTMTIGMSDFGVHVEVSAPPAAQVFDATDLAAQGAASALNQGSTS